MKCCEPLPILSRKLLFLLLLGGLAFANVTIHLKSDVTESSPTLAKIAAIEGDAKLADFIGSLRVDPKYLSDGILSKEEVRDILRSHYIDVAKISIVGGPARLYGSGQNLSKAQIEMKVRAYLASKFPNLVVESISIPIKSVAVEGGRYQILIKKRSQTFRHLYLTLEVRTPHGVVRTVPVTVKVTQLVNAAFAKRDIPKGRVITPEDVEFRKVKRYNSLQKGIEPSLLYGSVAKRTIRAGQQIRPSAYEPDYAVKKRSSVKILYDRGGIRIELLGLALENGQKGDIIKVKNLSSNKVLRCKVLSSNSVLFVQ